MSEMSGNLPEKNLKSEVVNVAGLRFSLADLALRDENGAVVPLRHQSSQVLAALINANGKIVSKDNLIDQVWGKIAVTDDSLTQCITDIRKVLNDKDHRIVRTLSRKGYLFSPANIALPSQSKFGLKRWWLVGALSAFIVAIWFAFQPSPPAQRPAIAVLAFDDLSVVSEKGYFSDAISEGIITELARFPQFATIARNSSFSFRDKPRDIREIGSVLGAQYILEGSQQKSGEKLLVTVQLIDATNGTHIWAESFDSELGDLFKIQAEVVRTIAASVGGKLSSYVPPMGGRQAVTALHLHAKGLQHLERSTFDEVEKARAFFEAAIDADPTSSLGYIGMGFYYRYLSGFAEDKSVKETAWNNAKVMADKAVLMDPSSYLSHYLLGRLYVLAGEMALATEQFNIAGKLNPSASEVLVGGSSAKLYVGNAQQAVEDIKLAMKIDPLHPEWYHWQLGWALWELQDCDGALASFQRMSVVPEPANRTLAAIKVCAGDIEGAKSNMAKFLEVRPDATLASERENNIKIWTAPGSLDRWIENLRTAGMPE